jgi:hypothetical protein
MLRASRLWALPLVPGLPLLRSLHSTGTLRTVNRRYRCASTQLLGLLGDKQRLGSRSGLHYRHAHGRGVRGRAATIAGRLLLLTACIKAAGGQHT